MTPLIAARNLTAEFGWSVVPVGRHKRPLIESAELGELFSAPPSPAQFRDWQRRFPRAEFALACGAVSDLIVLDVEFEGLPEFLDEPMGRTVFSYTPSGGRHFYFRYAEGIPITSWDDGGTRLADIKSDRSLVMLPPSVAGGRRYEWGLSPWEAEPNEVPPIVEAIVERRGGADHDLGKVVLGHYGKAHGGSAAHGHASRSESDASIAVQMLAGGSTPEAVYEVLVNGDAAIDRKRQGVKYAERTLRNAARWVNDLIPNAVITGIARRAGAIALGLRLLDGAHAGRGLRMVLDWPPTERSGPRWDELVRATELAEVPDDVHGLGVLRQRRVAVQVLPRGNGHLGLGRIYPARSSPIEV